MYEHISSKYFNVSITTQHTYGNLRRFTVCADYHPILERIPLPKKLGFSFNFSGGISENILPLTYSDGILKPDKAELAIQAYKDLSKSLQNVEEEIKSVYRRNVIKYLKKHITKPLIWRDAYSQENDIKTLPPELKTLDSIVIKMVEYAQNFCSYDLEGNKETRSRKWRSDFDIWRHIIYFKPEVTIFQVHSSLFDLANELSIFPGYCDDINRIRFYINDDDDEDFIDWIQTQYSFVTFNDFALANQIEFNNDELER